MDPQERLAEIEPLKQKLDQIQDELDGLISEMRQVPPEQRQDERWGPSGSFAMRMTALFQQREELVRQLMWISLSTGTAEASDPNIEL
jgi:hypothetical protein